MKKWAADFGCVVLLGILAWFFFAVISQW